MTPRDVVAVVNGRHSRVSSQARVLAAWSAEAGHPITRTVSSDEDVALALEDVRRGEVAGLVVARLDVLGDVVDQEVTAAALRRFGGVLFVVQEVEVPAHEREARKLLRLYDERRMEMDTRAQSAKLRKGYNAAVAERGRAGGRTAYGYKTVAGQIVEDAQEQAIVARIGDLWDDGQGYSAIGRQLQIEGYTKRDGSPHWHPDTVRRIVQRIEADRRAAEPARS